MAHLKDMDSSFLIHVFDEINESDSRGISTNDYYDMLIKWGITPNVASECVRKCDPKNTGIVQRKELCRQSGPTNPLTMFSPLQDVTVISTDIPTRKCQSIIKIVLDENAKSANEKGVKMLKNIQSRLSAIYGPGWNAWLTKAHYDGILTHEEGTSLVFSHKGTIYGVFKTPSVDY